VAVQGSSLAALVMGGFAILVGLAWLVGAIGTRRRRAEILPTYSATGGPVYTAVQLGCAGILILLGIGLIVGMLVLRGLR